MAVVGRLAQNAITSVAILLVAAAFACSARPADYEEDFTAVVEQICADYCEMNLACHEPAWFETYEACDDTCLGLAYIYNDTDCGQAKRNMYECIGSTSTCELYNDTNNVHADQYTCKTEKDRWVSLDCGQSTEDPFQAP